MSSEAKPSMTPAMWRAVTYTDMLTLAIVGMTFRADNRGLVRVVSVDPDYPKPVPVKAVGRRVLSLGDYNTRKLLWDGLTDPAKDLVRVITTAPRDRPLLFEIGHGWYTVHPQYPVQDVWWTLKERGPLDLPDVCLDFTTRNGALITTSVQDEWPPGTWTMPEVTGVCIHTKSEIWNTPRRDVRVFFDVLHRHRESWRQIDLHLSSVQGRSSLFRIRDANQDNSCFV